MITGATTDGGLDMKLQPTIKTLGLAALLMTWGVSAPAAAAPGDSVTTPGEFIVGPPTLENLGFEWHIDGDANRNASVEVSYRKAGQTAWRKALPLLRVHNERTYWARSPQSILFNLVAPNMFAGSILDLEPGTTYEARFVLSDPDGPREAVKTVTVKTRAEPAPAVGGKVYHVYPAKFRGPKTEPSYEGIMCAYNYYCGAGDTGPGGRPRVKPGDTLLLHAGTYANMHEYYANQISITSNSTFEGTYYLTADGTPEKPIVIKAAGDGEVVIDGRGNHTLFNVMAADYTYFEGLTFRNTDIAIWAGSQAIAGAKGLTVKNSRFDDIGMGVYGNNSRSTDFYIADNLFIGRNDATHLQGWTGDFWKQFEFVDGQQFPPVMKSYAAVKIYGSGHVVAHNYVAHFHDGIDTDVYGMPDGSHPHDGPNYPPREYWDRRPTSIDILNNYITNAHDNSIEMDGSMHNIRVMRNMLINSASHPMSTQPSGGGPFYFIRNVVFNAPGGSTRFGSNSPGVLFYNNTVAAETAGGIASNVHWRNNIMLPANAAPATFSVTTTTNYSSSDYNGFGVKPGPQPAFQWNSPAWSVTSVDLGPALEPKLEQRSFRTLADYQRETKQDAHSILLDYDALVKVPRLDGKDLATVQKLYDAADLDFRLRPGSAAADRGVALPNVTDGFAGRAPDLGALELGQRPPIYGPRPK